MSKAAAGTVQEVATRLGHIPPAGSFTAAEIVDLPEPVRRYFAASVAIGTPLARSARFRMRGSIKLGRRWLRFKARQVMAPLDGFVWAARVAGVLTGSDRLVEGEGAMGWKLFGLVPLMHAEGLDVSRSSAGRAGAESVWLPTAMLPRAGVRWSVTDGHHAVASYRLADTDLELSFTLDDEGRARSVALDRWGDPDGTGNWGLHRFEHALSRHGRFDGVTVPTAGRAAWLIGETDWAEGEFFRYEITDFHLIA